MLHKLLFRASDRALWLSRKLKGAGQRVSGNETITHLECERLGWKNVRPCFVLSTGRCGTLALSHALALSANAHVEHQPRPELIRASKRAYEEIGKSPELFVEVFKSAREEYLLEAAIRNQVFVETNNRITFFAPVIRSVFPNAVFIHLVRHPGDFVRSGIRRRWYSGKHDHDVGRIEAHAGDLRDEWPKLSLISKIAWLWNETNAFIESFIDEAGEGVLFVKAEELFADISVSEQIYSFLDLQGFDARKITSILSVPVNKQTRGEWKPYREWERSEKEELKRFAPLSKRYGYDV